MTTALELNPIPRRPRVGCSCYHGDAIKSELEVQHNAVAGLFRQAIALLPIEDMPDLLRCVVSGGACFGLLDPVSNIVLSAVSYLDHLERPPPEELARRAAMTVQERQCEESQNRIMNLIDIDMAFVETIGLRFVSQRSVFGHAVFLRNYFRYLTEDQAARYVELADYDLALAVMLVHHDHFAGSDGPSLNIFPDPSSNKTRAAFKNAACDVRLHAPTDDFVLLANSLYPRDLLEKATARLLRKEKLGPSDVEEMLLLMRWRSGDVPDKDDPNLVKLTVLRNPEEMATKVKNCLESALISITTYSSNPQPSSSSCDDYHQKAGSLFPLSKKSCDYHRGLKFLLLNTIHVFYLQAFAKVPSQFLRAHLRGILKGGHCFGPLDPVSNIILNAIWYDLAFPLEVDGDEKEAADVLNNRCLLRMERRSLDGLIALFAEFLGGSSNNDSAFSEQYALEYLCSKNCDMSADLSRVYPETRTQ